MRYRSDYKPTEPATPNKKDCHSPEIGNTISIPVNADITGSKSIIIIRN